MTMQRQLDTSLFSLNLTDKQYDTLKAFIYDTCGIKLNDGKKVMLEGRLRKRLRATGISDFDEYIDFVFTEEGAKQELVHMIDSVTTNKTDFFREKQHFDFLVNHVIPVFRPRLGSGQPFRVWSAGCSTGEEPYTLAMVLSEVKRLDPQFDFSIIATDISTKVLSKAVNGVYEIDKVAPVPEDMKKRYLLRSKDPSKRVVRVVPELRKKITFGRVNFMDATYPIDKPVHVVFCRNVIIYFDQVTQQSMITKLARHMVPGGFLFMGHSETLHGLNVPLVSAAPTVYRRPS